MTRATEILARANEKIKWGTGKKKKKFWIEKLTEISDFFIQELNISVKVKVSFKKMGVRQYGHMALAVGQQDNFTIDINDAASFKFWISALAHELTHVAQVARGDLSLKDTESVVWKGKEFSIADYLSHGDDPDKYTEYKTHPWEVEAFANQKRLTALAKDKFDEPIPAFAKLNIDANWFD